MHTRSKPIGLIFRTTGGTVEDMNPIRDAIGRKNPKMDELRKMFVFRNGKKAQGISI